MINYTSSISYDDKKFPYARVIFLSLIFMMASIGLFRSTPIFQNNHRFIPILTFLIFISFSIYKYFTKRSLFLKLKLPNSVFGWLALIFWEFFSILVIFSQISHGNNIFLGVGLLFILPIFIFMVIPYILISEKEVVYSGFISGAILLSISYLFYPPSGSVYYSGIFENPNNLGIISFQTALCGIFTIYYLFYSNKKQIILKIISTLFLSFSIYSLVISRSRSSLLSLLIAAFIFISFLIIKRKINGITFIGLFFGSMIFYFSYLREIIKSLILKKFLNQILTNSFLSGRERIWKTIISDSKLFGNGSDYFDEKLGIAAHNGILHFWGAYGYLSSIFLILFTISISIICIKKLSKTNFDNVFFSSVYALSFLSLNLAESLITFVSHSPTIIFYITVGFLMFKKRTDI
ncbi:hypothetical protein [Facklamia sp. 7083-14-GEN3]|uniref:hypothetical protein n=1 Tax=Facklamia sp. 7083-14-GEN3 TaxID=2973478 RepID=UPI00215D1FB2|nr:hypothetical protein [Facklamia sp. 7083-14-GEN3]MCR8968936.1 hypothetical protein [Facklamia sp. 7083-14-GEN3]